MDNRVLSLGICIVLQRLASGESRITTNLVDDAGKAAMFLLNWEINTAASSDSELLDIVKSVIKKTNQNYLNGTPKVRCWKPVCTG